MTRLAPYQSRPEDAANADAYYDASESKRYHLNTEVAQKQLELTCRALDFLALGQTAPSLQSPFLVADIGCGSGLSGDVLSKLGWPWIGLDVSQHMLQVGVLQQEPTVAALIFLYTGAVVFADLLYRHKNPFC